MMSIKAGLDAVLPDHALFLGSLFARPARASSSTGRVFNTSTLTRQMRTATIATMEAQPMRNVMRFQNSSMRRDRAGPNGFGLGIVVGGAEGGN